MPKPARGGQRGVAGGGIPRMNNPAGIPSNAMTEGEFLALRGVDSPTSFWSIDKLRGNRQVGTTRGRERFQREFEENQREYEQRRNEAREEYQRLIASGQIRDKTTVERSLTRAHGNPDNESTQAARRMLAKRGIDWRTGKKISG